jgi:hypothetical protein
MMGQASDIDDAVVDAKKPAKRRASMPGSSAGGKGISFRFPE